jgi:hypothetical protein
MDGRCGEGSPGCERIHRRSPESLAQQIRKGPGLFFGFLLAVVDIAEMRRLTVVTAGRGGTSGRFALFGSKRLGRRQTSGAQRGSETAEKRGNDRPREPEQPQVR